MNIDRNHNPSVEQVLKHFDMSTFVAQVSQIVSEVMNDLPYRKEVYVNALKDIRTLLDNYGFDKYNPRDIEHIRNIRLAINAGADGYHTNHFRINFNSKTEEEDASLLYYNIGNLPKEEESYKVIFFDGCVKHSIVIDLPAYEEVYTHEYEIDGYNSFVFDCKRWDGEWKIDVRSPKKGYTEIISIEKL